jgi:hypothetical protein
MTTSTCLAAIVLLIDASGSISNQTYAAQRDGTASAFETPQIVRAIEASGGIAVQVTEFEFVARVQIDWTILRSAEDASRLATAFHALERSGSIGNTAIGHAIAHAHRELSTAPCLPEFRLIDIATDGEETTPRIPARQARDAAAADGIIINAIAFASGYADDGSGRDGVEELAAAERWLRENVATGFVRVAADAEGFVEAFRNKLVEEVSMLRQSAAIAAPQ